MSIEKSKVLKALSGFLAEGMDEIAAANKILETMSPGPPWNTDGRQQINQIIFKSREAKKIIRKHVQPTKWKVRSLDVWGNAEDGFDVNNEFNAGQIEIPWGSDDAELLKLFKKKDYLQDDVTLKDVEFDEQSSDGFFAVQDKKTGEPLYHVYREQ